jgi:outer membrane protein
VRIFLILIFLSVFAWAAPARADGTLTLRDCYRMALARSESLAIQEDTIRIAEAHYLQALGNVLPHLNTIATEVIQDTGGGAAGGGGSSAVGNTLTRRSRPEVTIQLTQPLFQGFREFKALHIANAEKSRNSLQTDRARQILFSDVARAYYTVMQVERIFDTQSSLIGTLSNRTKELRDRIEIGKSRNSELLTTESQLAVVQANLEATRGQIVTSREFLGFLVGASVTQKLVDEFKTPERLAPVTTYVATLEGRPDIGASAESVRLAQGKLDFEKGALYPTLDFVGNYYPYRVGFLKDINWDLTFTLNIPIFQGGLTRGRIREAAVQLNQAQLSDSESNRQGELEVRQAYESLKSALAQQAALQRSESKANESFQVQQNEYRLGLVNNLDVLQALRTLQEQKLEALQEYYDAKLQYLNLLVAAGQLPPKKETSE